MSVSKLKITITATVEYDIDDTCYPPMATDDEKLSIDIAAAEADPSTFMEMENAVFTVTGEVIKEKGINHE